jgi:Na+-transporting NADH:ubiquinone oxidoreductase subunit A
MSLRCDRDGGGGRLNIHRLKRGLDLPLAGEPAQVIGDAAPVRRVALLGSDHPGLRPSMLVQPGERVRRGQPVFEDRKHPGLRWTAPAAGTVHALHRGERRAFESLVIEIDGDDAHDAQATFDSWRRVSPDALSGSEVRALLLESGLWTALRTRPFSKVPAPDSTPHALFITAMDTRPHAPSVDVVLADRLDDFRLGAAALARLGAARTYSCVAEGSMLAWPEIDGVVRERFDGPHPAGNAGTHIHWLCPADLQRSVWHIGYQDVAAIGRLLRSGRLEVERVISLAGPSVLRPRLVRARLGASIDQLAHGEIDPGAQRLVSGSVLDGRRAAGDVHGYLGRYHLQLSALAEGGERELFGWIAPGADKFSVWGVVLGAWRRRPKLALTTTTNGGSRAMVPIGSFERVMPLDLMPTFLLRALLMKDDERAEALGALELDEDDLALCTFVCPGKAEYGPLLREALTRIEKEAA